MEDSHKVWLIAGISVVILIIAGLVFVPMMQGNFAGEAVFVGDGSDIAIGSKYQTFYEINDIVLNPGVVAGTYILQLTAPVNNIVTVTLEDELGNVLGEDTYSKTFSASVVNPLILELTYFNIYITRPGTNSIMASMVHTWLDGKTIIIEESCDLVENGVASGPDCEIACNEGYELIAGDCVLIPVVLTCTNEYCDTCNVFDGTNYESLGADFHPQSTGDFSVSVWIKTDQETTQGTWGPHIIGDHQHTALGGWALSLGYTGSEGKINFKGSRIISDPDLWYLWDTTTDLTYNEDGWHHVVAMRDADDLTTGIKIYVDGYVVKTGTQSSGDVSNDYDLTLGADNGGDENHYEGLIYNPQIFDTLLTQEQIDILYNSGSGESVCALAGDFNQDGVVDANDFLSEAHKAAYHDLIMDKLSVSLETLNAFLWEVHNEYIN
jgi:hypothetical protein